ncbi:olfactory receptor 52E4-like [Rhinophrynus dorsalis]
MENVSSIISNRFVLLGIAEMEELKYFYLVLLLITYLFTLLFNTTIVFVVWTEDSLHSPMYILICNLFINGIFGSSSFLPKLMTDLFTSSKLITRTGCSIQAFCVSMFAYYEISAFTIMAYDTYLAVWHPLQYATLMTKEKVLKLIAWSFLVCLVLASSVVLLGARLPLCGIYIKNIFCDNMSIVILSCADISVNSLYGSITFMSFLIFNLLIIAYSYLQIFLICLKVSKDAYEKAIHTLVTHLLNFSIFLVGVLFIFIRYRLGNVTLPLVFHILLSVHSLLLPPLLNPVIYGIRTKALKLKLVLRLQKIHVWTR